MGGRDIGRNDRNGSKTEQGVRARWEADVDGTTVKPTPSEVDEFAFVWGAVVPGTGVIGIDSDPDLVAQMADDRGGWVSLIRVHPGPRVLPQAPMNADGSYRVEYTGAR